MPLYKACFNENIKMPWFFLFCVIELSSGNCNPSGSCFCPIYVPCLHWAPAWCWFDRPGSSPTPRGWAGLRWPKGCSSWLSDTPFQSMEKQPKIPCWEVRPSCFKCSFQCRLLQVHDTWILFYFLSNLWFESLEIMTVKANCHSFFFKKCL